MGNIPFVSFLSDFGTREYYVSAVKGVILEQCREAQIIDISHHVRSHDLLEGAFTLACAAPYFPRGTVHLAVVDPGVGSSRRALAVSDGHHLFVGPDNGILSLVFQQTETFRVYSIEARHYFRQPVSATFHGRDIFGPVAGQLAKGLEIAKLGPEISDPVRLHLPPLKPLEAGQFEALVLHIDKFGNITTSVRPEDLAALGLSIQEVRFRVGETSVDQHCSFYAEAQPNELFSILGSAGYYEIACSRQPAAGRLTVRRGAKIRIQTRE